MTTFAKVREPEMGNVMAECIANRDLEVELDPTLRYIVMSEEVHDKFKVDYDSGEMLIYSPYFRKDLSCMWVVLTIDFDFTEL
jgi:hypothetical protein